MKKKIKYTDESMGEVRVVSDFLPSPDELALKDETRLTAWFVSYCLYI